MTMDNPNDLQSGISSVVLNYIKFARKFPEYKLVEIFFV